MPPGGSKKVRSSIEQSVVVALGEIARVTTVSPSRGPGGYGDLQAVGAALGRFGLGDELVERREASLTLALSGPRRQANPLEFSFEGGLADFVGLLFSRESGLLLFEPRGVVAFPGNAVPAVELENPLRGVVEEVTVVCDRDNGTAVLRQRSF